MTPDFDALRPAPPKPASLEAIRAALAQEATRPRRGWRRGALVLAAASTGLAALAALGALMAGETTVAVASSRWVSLLLVGLSGPLAVVAALQPGRGPLRLGAALVSLAGAVALVATRPSAVASGSASPEWVCTASHLAVALPAMVVASLVLRGFARSPWRSVLAGVAVGTTGALLGELMCGRAAAHIAVFHLGAWLVATVVVSLTSLALSRRSFAP